MDKDKNQKIWDSLSKFLTFLIVAIYLLNVLNGIFNFIPNGTIFPDVVYYLSYYGPMALVIVVSLEVFDGKKNLFRYILLFCWLFIVLFSISPDLFGLIK